MIHGPYNVKVYYRLHLSLSWARLIQFTPSQFFFLQIHFNIIPLINVWSSKLFFSFLVSPPNVGMYFASPSYILHFLPNLSSFFNRRNGNWKDVKLWTSLLCNFLSFPRVRYFLPQQPSLSRWPSAYVVAVFLRDHISRSYKTGCKFVFSVFNSLCVQFYPCGPWSVGTYRNGNICNFGNAAGRVSVHLVCCVLCRLLFVAHSSGNSEHQTVNNAAVCTVCCMFRATEASVVPVCHTASICHVPFCKAVPHHTA